MRTRLFALAIVAASLSAHPAETKTRPPSPPTGTAESFIRQEIAAGRDVDFVDRCGAFEPREIDDVAKATSCRTISGSALAKLMQDKRLEAALPAHGLVVTGLYVKGDVDLQWTALPANIVCKNCLFAGRIELKEAFLAHDLRFEGSELLGGLDATAAKIDGRLSFLGGTTVRGGKVDLSSATIADMLETEDARFDAESVLDASNAQFAQALLRSSTFAAGIEGDDAEIAGTLRLAGGSKVHGRGLVAKGITIGSLLAIGEASQLEGIDLSGAHLKGGLDIAAHAHVGALGIAIEDAAIEGELSIQNVVVEGRVLADGANVGKCFCSKATGYTSDLSLNRLGVGGDVDISGGSMRRLLAQKMHVGGSLYLKGAMIDDGGVDLKGTSVGADMEFADVGILGDLDLAAATIGKELDLQENTRVEGTARLVGTSVAGDLLIGNASLQGQPPVRLANADFGLVRVASSVFAHNVVFAHTPQIVGADIKGHLDIAGAVLPGLDMTRASVGGDFRLAAREDPHTATAWARKALLTLKNAHVGVVQDENGVAEGDPWPGAVDLQGFSYDHFANDPPITWASHWLDSSSFVAEPFFRLAKYYSDEGRKELSDQILYKAKRKQTAAAYQACAQADIGACAHALGLTMLWALIGYGIGNGLFQALIWVFVLTIIGALVLRRTRDVTPQSVLWGGPDKGRLWCIGASFNHLIPLVELNKEFKDFFDAGRKRLWPWQMIYFAAHAVMGYVLASFVVAALAGLTQSH